MKASGGLPVGVGKKKTITNADLTRSTISGSRSPESGSKISLPHRMTNLIQGIYNKNEFTLKYTHLLCTVNFSFLVWRKKVES